MSLFLLQISVKRPNKKIIKAKNSKKKVSAFCYFNFGLHISNGKLVF